ncbi:MAG: class GN sortase [Woeseiaceae bacterium]
MTACLAVGMINLADGLYIPAKAALAQHLLQRAWQRGETLDGVDDPRMRPWPWADTFPIARLTGDSLDDEMFILSGASGRTLAFGPGHLQASAMPGEPGNAVIAGHRDTHFRFLEDVVVGDRFVIDRRDGERIVFEVDDLQITDSRQASISLDTDEAKMTLVTCYPFDAIQAGGPLRYVVSAHRL